MVLKTAEEITSWTKVYVPVDFHDFDGATSSLVVGGRVGAKTKHYETLIAEALDDGGEKYEQAYWVPKFFLNEFDMPIADCNAVEIAVQMGDAALPERVKSRAI